MVEKNIFSSSFLSIFEILDAFFQYYAYICLFILFLIFSYFHFNSITTKKDDNPRRTDRELTTLKLSFSNLKIIGIQGYCGQERTVLVVNIESIYHLFFLFPVIMTGNG